MDPLTRKLFQPREAREKLRGMGGIMSSSPQLASTVAKFQQGGPIQSRALALPSAPDAPLPSAGRARATRVGDRTFVLTDDGRVLDAQTGAPAPQDVAAEVRSRLSPQLSMADILGDAPDFSGGVNPSFREDTSGQLPSMPSDLAPMSVPADPRAPFDMDAFQRDLTGAGRAVAGPGLMAIDDLAYDGPLISPAQPPRTPREDTHSADLRAAIEAAQAGGSSVEAPSQVVDEFSMMPYGNVGNESVPELAPRPAGREAQRAAIEAQLEDPNLSDFEREALETRLLGLSGQGFIADAGTMALDSLGRIISAPGRVAGAAASALGATGPGAALLEAYDAGYYDSESPRYRNATETDPTRGPDDGTRGGGPAAPVETAETETPVADVETPETPVADPETPAAPTIDVDLDDPSTYDTDFEEMMRRLGGATGKDDKSSRQKAMADLAMIGLAIAAGQSPDALTNIAQGALTGMKAIRAEDAAKDAVASETRALAAKLATDREIARIRVPSGGGTYTPDRMIAQAVDSILAQPDFFDVMGDDGKTTDMAKVAQRARDLVENIATTQVMTADEGSLPTVSTQEEFDALDPGPNGVYFIQNGQRRFKPAQ